MKTLTWLLTVSLFAFSSLAVADEETPYLVSAGLGVLTDPTMVLFSPQVEYPITPNLWLGPLIQAGLGNGTLVTLSWGARFVASNHSAFKPTLEGAVGLAIGGGNAAIGSSLIGIHLMVGAGVDYRITDKMFVGTMVRGNLAPPLRTLFVTWPLLMGRFLL